MQPSRRQALSRRQAFAAIGSGAALALAGCVVESVGDDSNDTDDQTGAPGPTVDTQNDSTDGNEASPQDDSTEAPTFPTEGPLEARLVGPETEYHLFDRSSIADVSEVQQQHDHYAVGVTLTEERANAFSEAIQDEDLTEDPTAYEVVLTVDGEEIRRSPITAGLAEVWENGTWERQFLIHSPTEQEAERLREALV